MCRSKAYPIRYAHHFVLLCLVAFLISYSNGLWSNQKQNTSKLWTCASFFECTVYGIVCDIFTFLFPCDSTLRGMFLDLTGDKSTLVQVMARCCEATSHYMMLCWPRSMSPYGVTKPQWVYAIFAPNHTISDHIPFVEFRAFTLPVWHTSALWGHCDCPVKSELWFANACQKGYPSIS